MHQHHTRPMLLLLTPSCARGHTEIHLNDSAGLYLLH